MKQCQFCFGDISDDAIKCKHCGELVVSKEMYQQKIKEIAKSDNIKSKSKIPFIITTSLALIGIFVSIAIYYHTTLIKQDSEEVIIGERNKIHSIFIEYSTIADNTLVPLAMSIFLGMMGTDQSDHDLIISIEKFKNSITAENTDFEQWQKKLSDSKLKLAQQLDPEYQKGIDFINDGIDKLQQSMISFQNIKKNLVGAIIRMQLAENGDSEDKEELKNEIENFVKSISDTVDFLEESKKLLVNADSNFGLLIEEYPEYDFKIEETG